MLSLTKNNNLIEIVSSKYPTNNSAITTYLLITITIFPQVDKNNHIQQTII